jgi:hypothetical protein
MSLPAGVVVSAQASPNDLNVAPALPIASSVFRRSRVDRASLSSLHTTSVSPIPSAWIAFASCGLSVYAPLSFSANILAQPISDQLARALEMRLIGGHLLEAYTLTPASEQRKKLLLGLLRTMAATSPNAPKARTCNLSVRN